MKRRLVIAGGTGFIGKALSRLFSDRGFEVVVLTRQQRTEEDGIRYAQWNGKTLRGRRCIPRRFQEAGFPFRFPSIEEALEDLNQQPNKRRNL